MGEQGANTPAATARRLIRTLDRATLATSQNGWPYASLVLAATGHDGTPLLLCDLAEHSKNITREARMSLLFDGRPGATIP